MAALHRALPSLLALAMACGSISTTAYAQRPPATRPRRPASSASPAPASSSASPASPEPAAITASSASPEPPPADPMAERRTRAGEEFAAGVTAYRRGDFVTAANHFSTAYETLPDPAPLFNMARAWEGANEIQRAIEAYQHYLVAAPQATDRAEVLARIDVLRSRPTEVFVTSEPAGAQVFLDEDRDPQRETTPMVLRVLPGPHVLVLERDGNRRTVRRLTARAGVTETVSVALESTTPTAAARPAGRVDARILSRRTPGLLAARFTFLIGAARPWNDQPFALSVGGSATMFIARGITSTLHFERIEPDGVWTIMTGDFGYTLGIEDIDISLLATAGVGYGWLDHASFAARAPMQWTPMLGFEARAEWVFHPHIATGLYFRASWRNFGIGPIEPLNSLGVSISLLF